MNDQQIEEMRKRAEISTGQCLLRERFNAEGASEGFEIIAPDGETVMFTTINDNHTAQFQADAREIVLALCDELKSRNEEIASLQARLAANDSSGVN